MWMQQTPTPYDGLLVIATSLHGLSSNNWNPMLVPGGASGGGPFIQVDLDQQAIGRSFPITLGVVAEAGAFIRTLADPELLMKFPPDPAVVAGAARRRSRTSSRSSPFFNPEQYTSNATPIEPGGDRPRARRHAARRCPDLPRRRHTASAGASTTSRSTRPARNP